MEKQRLLPRIRDCWFKFIISKVTKNKLENQKEKFKHFNFLIDLHIREGGPRPPSCFENSCANSQSHPTYMVSPRLSSKKLETLVLRSYIRHHFMGYFPKCPDELRCLFSLTSRRAFNNNALRGVQVLKRRF